MKDKFFLFVLLLTLLSLGYVVSALVTFFQTGTYPLFAVWGAW